MSAQAKYQFLESYYPDMLTGVGALIQKAKVAARFESVSLSDDEFAELKKAQSICELAILEQWNDQETERFKALCSTYFDVSSQIPLDSQPLYAVFELIKLVSTGYLGENWQSVRQLLRVHVDFWASFNEGDNWGERLLITSFKALTGLITKENWTAIQSSVELIEALRQQQQEFEAEYLNSLHEKDKPFGAAELVSLYHFAKTVEILGQYLLNGRPLEVEELIIHHLGYANEFAQKSGNITLELLFQFFEGLSKKLIRNTIWYSTRGINSRVASFNQFISRKEEQGVFELLYPQKEAILDGGLLNPAHSAIVVNLPTSSGKTLIAEYRTLMAINQFAGDGGWVAYIVPTRALVNQVYIQLKKDLSPIGVRVEKVKAAHWIWMVLRKPCLNKTKPKHNLMFWSLLMKNFI